MVLSKKQQLYILCVFAALIPAACYGQKKSNAQNMKPEQVACKLTTPELQERKRTVIAGLKELVLERIETENGMRFRFPGSEKNIELLISFIKTERLCCNFFTFDLTVGNEDDFVWLTLSGPEGTKDFIKAEIGF
jgi:hypothetical protein